MGVTHRDLVIVGCGAVGLEILSIAMDSQCVAYDTRGENVDVEVIGFYDGGEPRAHHANQLIGCELEYFSSAGDVPKNAAFVISVANPAVRHSLYMALERMGLSPITLIHSSAIVSNTAVFGAGCVLCPFSYIGPFADVGRNTLVSNYSSVAHDARIGESSVLHAYSTVNGFATCGAYSTLATRSTVLASVRLGAYSTLSAGSVLGSDTKDGSLAEGNPATHRVEFEESGEPFELE